MRLYCTCYKCAEMPASTGWCNLGQSTSALIAVVPAVLLQVRTLPYVRGDGPVAAPAFNDTVYPENPAFALQAKLVDPLALSA